MLEIEKIKLERCRLESEKCRIEFENRKQRLHELEVLRMKKECKNSGFNFVVCSAIKLVPSFSENKVSDFFISFEKVADALQWPEDKWTTLLQCRFVGKAQKVYGALSEEVSVD